MATWKGEDDPRLVLARRLYKETHDADTVAKGMRSLGYGREESAAAAAHVARKTSPRPGDRAGGRATGQAAPRAQGAPQPATPTPPRGGGGLSDWLGSGPAMPKPTLHLPSRPSSTQVVGFGFGMVAYVLFITYLRYGPAGVKGWFGAKLLNVPYSAPAAPLDGSGGEHFGNPGPPGNPDPGLSSTRPQPAAPPSSPDTST